MQQIQYVQHSTRERNMSRDEQYAPCQSVPKDRDAPSINPGSAQPLTDDIRVKNETHQSPETLMPQHQGFFSRSPMSPLGQTHHRHPIPLDSQAHVPATKSAETEEIAFRINVKQAHRILKRRTARQKFEEKFDLSLKSRKSYDDKSRRRNAMPLPRGPDGRFLARAKVAAMANGIDGEGEEGRVNDAPLAATFQGYINTGFDALIVFEACLSGKLIPIFRRPKRKDLLELIQSGNVFVYKVEESGVKRWRDNVSWSPGCKLENFKVYQELEQLSVPGAGEGGFKKNGLVKKTIGITYQSVKYRLVSYYKCEDVKQGRFLSPSQHHELGRITPRDELITQKFDAPINTTGMNSTLDHFHGPVPMAHAYSSPIIQQGEISMDYSTDIIGCYYAPQHLLLSYLQPQYEEQQYTMFYSLPHYLGEQLAAPTQPSGTEILM